MVVLVVAPHLRAERACSSPRAQRVPLLGRSSGALPPTQRSSHTTFAARADDQMLRLCALLLARALASDGERPVDAVCTDNSDCASRYCGNRRCEVRSSSPLSFGLLLLASLGQLSCSSGVFSPRDTHPLPAPRTLQDKKEFLQVCRNDDSACKSGFCDTDGGRYAVTVCLPDVRAAYIVGALPLLRQTTAAPIHPLSAQGKLRP